MYVNEKDTIKSIKDGIQQVDKFYTPRQCDKYELWGNKVATTGVDGKEKESTKGVKVTKEECIKTCNENLCVKGKDETEKCKDNWTCIGPKMSLPDSAGNGSNKDEVDCWHWRMDLNDSDCSKPPTKN